MSWGLIWIVSIIVATGIGASRGSMLGGILLGAFFGPIGVVAAFGLRGMDRAPCPFCKEMINNRATKCPRCQSDLTAAFAEANASASKPWNEGLLMPALIVGVVAIMIFAIAS